MLDQAFSSLATKRAKAIVRATTNYDDAAVLAEVSEGLGEAMVGINCGSMAPGEKIAGRGWWSHVMTLHGRVQAEGCA